MAEEMKEILRNIEAKMEKIEKDHREMEERFTRGEVFETSEGTPTTSRETVGQQADSYFMKKNVRFEEKAQRNSTEIAI